jgi:hypothetical protein
MHKTPFAGLTELEPGESIFEDGSSFTATNPSVIDHYLQLGARTITTARPRSAIR